MTYEAKCDVCSEHTDDGLTCGECIDYDGVAKLAADATIAHVAEVLREYLDLRHAARWLLSAEGRAAVEDVASEAKRREEHDELLRRPPRRPEVTRET